MSAPRPPMARVGRGDVGDRREPRPQRRLERRDVARRRDAGTARPEGIDERQPGPGEPLLAQVQAVFGPGVIERRVADDAAPHPRLRASRPTRGAMETYSGSRPRRSRSRIFRSATLVRLEVSRATRRMASSGPRWSKRHGPHRSAAPDGDAGNDGVVPRSVLDGRDRPQVDLAPVERFGDERRHLPRSSSKRAAPREAVDDRRDVQIGHRAETQDARSLPRGVSRTLPGAADPFTTPSPR